MALESKGFAGGGELSGANPVGRFLGRVSGQPFMQNVISNCQFIGNQSCCSHNQSTGTIPV